MGMGSFNYIKPDISIDDSYLIFNKKFKILRPKKGVIYLYFIKSIAKL